MKELKKIDGWRLKWLMLSAVMFVAYFTYVSSKYGFYSVIDSQEIIFKTLKAYVISAVTIYFVWDIYNYLFRDKEDYGNLRSNEFNSCDTLMDIARVMKLSKEYIREKLIGLGFVLDDQTVVVKSSEIYEFNRQLIFIMIVTFYSGMYLLSNYSSSINTYIDSLLMLLL